MGNNERKIGSQIFFRKVNEKDFQTEWYNCREEKCISFLGNSENIMISKASSLT